MAAEVAKMPVTYRQSAGKSFAYLLGVYLGDGCVTHVQGYDRFRLNTIDEDFAEATAEAILELTGKDCKINGPYVDKRFPKSRPQYQLCCCDTQLCADLKAETDSKLRMPHWIWKADKSIRLAFIAGLMDSEGHVTENKQKWTNRRFYMGFKSCDAWVLDFVRLLEETGIRTGKILVEPPRKAGYKPATGFRIKMQSWIDSGAYFNCSRKQSRVVEWGSIGPYCQREARRLSSTSIRPIP